MLRAFFYSDIFTYYLLVLNIVTFLLYALDEYKAVRHVWRIPESVLLLAVLLGGGIGAVMGMQLCRHKTRHVKFRVGVPLIILLQMGLVIYFR